MADALQEILLLKAVTAKAIIAIGVILLAIRRLFKDLHEPRYVRWVETECGFSMSSALNYMRVAKYFGKPEIATVAEKIDVTGLYQLAQKSVPEEVRAEMLSRAQNQDHLSAEEVDAYFVEKGLKPKRLEKAPLPDGVWSSVVSALHEKNIEADVLIVLLKPFETLKVSQFIVKLEQHRTVEQKLLPAPDLVADNTSTDGSELSEDGC